jgi:hypothetical protein
VISELELSRLRPSEGARFLLERDGETTSYRAWVITPEARFAYRAALAAGEEPELVADGDPAPAELEKMLRMIARLTARSGAPWPNRVLRWRGPGRGT